MTSWLEVPTDGKHNRTFDTQEARVRGILRQRHSLKRSYLELIYEDKSTEQLVIGLWRA